MAVTQIGSTRHEDGLRHMHKTRCSIKGTRDVWDSLTVGQAMRVETLRRGESDPRSLEVPSQFHREGSLQLLCRLAPREERLERMLRIIGPHSLREHFVLKFHCLLQLFAERALH